MLNHFVILLQLWSCQQFFIHLAQPFLLQCSSIFRLLQCSTILWFCYTELIHFATVLIHFMILLQLPHSFCDLVSNFYTLNSVIFATVPNHFSIANVLSHFVIPLHWTQPFCYSAQHFVILLQLPQSFCDLVSNFYTLNSPIFLLQCLSIFRLLQCLAIFVIFCYSYLSHFVILSEIFCTLNSTIFLL
jgi:hypothetical protein